MADGEGIRRRLETRALGLVGILLSCALPISAEEPSEAGGLKRALEATTVRLDQRYRLELVEDEAPAFEGREAVASTLRSQLALETGPLGGFRARVVVENVTVVGNDALYANAGAGSLSNGVTDRPVVADPEITDLLEAALLYEPTEGTKLTLGRQAVAVDDHRFVGTVAWRQHFQTVDALRWDQELPGGWKLLAAYLDRVHRITGSREDQDSVLLTASGDVPGGRLVFTVLDLDYREPQSAALSSATAAARFVGERETRAGRWLYELLVARQDVDAVADLPDVDLDYRHLMAGYGRRDWSLRIGAEILEGDGRRAFQTPLATLHKFNGWADRFLVTPADGLEDLYARLDHARGPWSATFRWHRFDADLGGARYGEEWNADLRWTLGTGPTLALRLARYLAEAHSTDVDKAMFYVSWGLDLKD